MKLKEFLHGCQMQCFPNDHSRIHNHNPFAVESRTVHNYHLTIHKISLLASTYQLGL